MIVLNPFEVSVGTDNGYAARETLAGTRFKSDLKDVASQVSVMTREFLEDIGSVTVEDAYRYSLNVENINEYMSATTGGGDFNTGVLNTRTANRIRGISAAGMTHDFFQTNVAQDTYNTERVSFSSGPNAILFGNGNPGGIVDGAFLRAQLTRARHSATIRTDNFGSLRTSFDTNLPILRDFLGIRLAAVKARENSWRDPDGRNDDRYFGTVTVRPFKSTTLRAWYEDSTIDRTPPRPTRFGDQVTPWIAAGRPTFDNGLAGTSVIGAGNNTIFARNTSTRNVWIFGAANPVPFQAWGSGNAVNIALPTTRYSAVTIGPGSTPNQTGADSYIYSLPYDESISPFDVSVNGNATRNVLYGKIWGASFEQRLATNLFLQVDLNRESVENPLSDFIRGIQSAIRADANRYLPDRVTPNPNVGRYYVEAEPRVFSFRGERREERAMLSYEVDFTRRDGWQKWLGLHRIAAMYQRSESMDVQQESVPRIVPAGTAPATVIDNYAAAMFNTAAYRAYLSDPQRPETGSTFSFMLPFDPIETTSYAMPDGSTYYAGYKNPWGATGAANMNNNLLEGRVLAMQNYFLKGRLVTSFGWRSDNVRQATYATKRKSSATNAAYVSIWDVEPPRNWSVYTSGKTSTKGVVLHVLPWLSGFYNQSNTWNPPTGLTRPNDGSQIPGAKGEGKDYGLMARFFQDRVSLRLNKYENTSGPSGVEGYRNAILPVVHNIENTLLDRYEDGTIGSYTAPKNYDPNEAVYASKSLLADLVSKGYEAELVANPSRQWRLSAGVAKSTATQSNIGADWVEFIRERAPIWTANGDLTGPGSTNETIRNRYLGIIQTLNQMAQADGQKVENGREWRVNCVTRYTFDSGLIKGVFVSCGYRWRSKQVLAYRASLVDNAFPFAGAPTQVLVPALNAPVYGSALKETDAMLGYSRRILRNVQWRVQLNVRNLFDDQDPMAQRANIALGTTTVYNVPDPRTFILTNTFSF